MLIYGDTFNILVEINQVADKLAPIADKNSHMMKVCYTRESIKIGGSIYVENK